MELTIPVFWIVLLIVLIHTGLQHLINWMWRSIYDDDSLLVGIIVTIAELIVLILALYLTLYVQSN